MQILLQIAVWVLLASFLVGTIRGILRRKLVRERTDTIFGLTRESKDKSIEAADGGFDTRLILFVEMLGLASGNVVIRVYLLLGAIALLLTVALWGWRAGLAMIGALAIGHVVLLRSQKRKRTLQFTEALPGLLERVRRLVMIGNTLPHAFIESVAAGDPIVKREIEPFIRRVQYGAPFTDCIEMLARHNEIVELHMLSAYVKTNAKFGGRVAQTLSNLIEQLSNKRRLEREIRSATAETRASATILFGLMAFLILTMSIMNPAYLVFYTGSGQGRLILMCILAWPLIGVLVMKRILTLDF